MRPRPIFVWICPVGWPIVWLAPIVLLLVVGISGFVFLRNRLKPTLPSAPKLSKEDAALVRAARKQENT